MKNRWCFKALCPIYRNLDILFSSFRVWLCLKDTLMFIPFRLCLSVLLFAYLLKTSMNKIIIIIIIIIISNNNNNRKHCGNKCLHYRHSHSSITFLKSACLFIGQLWMHWKGLFLFTHLSFLFRQWKQFCLNSYPYGTTVWIRNI